jgi:hypothetical protein
MCFLLGLGSIDVALGQVELKHTELKHAGREDGPRRKPYFDAKSKNRDAGSHDRGPMARRDGRFFGPKS